MARHLWAFCVALAAASQPQNATRQLDAYAPAPTDLSRACASWRPDRDEIDRVRTIRAGNFVNLAHATGGAFVASVSKVRRPPNYVPPGVYFSARDARVDDVTRDALRWGVSGGVNSDDRLPASFTRWRSMLRRVRTPDMRDDLLATFGARRGPAPIGTIFFYNSSRSRLSF